MNLNTRVIRPIGSAIVALFLVAGAAFATSSFVATSTRHIDSAPAALDATATDGATAPAATETAEPDRDRRADRDARERDRDPDHDDRGCDHRADRNPRGDQRQQQRLAGRRGRRRGRRRRVRALRLGREQPVRHRQPRRLLGQPPVHVRLGQPVRLGRKPRQQLRRLNQPSVSPRIMTSVPRWQPARHAMMSRDAGPAPSGKPAQAPAPGHETEAASTDRTWNRRNGRRSTDR